MEKQNIQLSGIFLLTIAIISSMNFIGCGSTVPLISDWNRTGIIIDGKADEWQGSLYILKKANVTIGVRNDADNLYLCFISYDQGVMRQILSGGLTVWFDPAGGSDEKYGIKYPAGFPKGNPAMDLENDGKPRQMPMNGAGETGDDMPPPGPAYMDTSFSKHGFNNIEGIIPPMADNIQHEIQFLGPEEKNVQQSTTIELKKMKVQIKRTQNAFTYELQVPLHKTGDFPFELAPAKGGIIGIEFKTEKISPGRHSGIMGRPRGGDMSGPPGGDMEGLPGGRGPGSFSGGREGKNLKSSNPIEVRTKVNLAKDQH
jgi:hypothetical protein